MAGIGAKSELLNVLSDVKARVMDKLGIVDFPMPQFILIGKQSVGKSRLIEALAGEQFNFISGSLGSRRPTVLEFRHNATLPKSRWSVRDMESCQWAEYPIEAVMKIIGDAHECLGETVSDEAVWCRIESPHCVDMQIVDLPGFRDFALDEAKTALGEKIHTLVLRYMADPKNVMLCVEQAGDASTMATLAKARNLDPKFERTILIRNKLDKYYNDLVNANVDDWLKGFGDLPDSLMKNCYSLTLPWWPEDSGPPPKPFAQIREDKNNEDVNTLQSKGASPVLMRNIGFKNFVSFMDKKVEKMFSDAINPVLESLREMQKKTAERKEELVTENHDTDPSKVLSTTRDCGKTFASALLQVMEGQFVEGRVDLETELRDFHQYHEAAGSDFMMLPSEDFAGLDDYIQYLRNSQFLSHNFDIELSGGSQFRRMLCEVEVFLRFSEVAADTKKRDVIQARGVSMTSLTWRDVVVKLLSAEAHVPLKQRVQYVGERVTFFFESQKKVIMNYMLSTEGARHIAQYQTHGKLIASNEMMRHLIFQAYDQAARRQLSHFMGLFQNMLTSTFANPWTFLKGGTAPDDITQIDPQERIPREIESRSDMESILNKWLQDIPTESHQIDLAVDEVQKLVLRIYSLIRSQVCDQVELFTESFFKIPMLRRLVEDMSNIELSDDDKATYEQRRIRLKDETTQCDGSMKEINECIDQLETFKLKTQMAM